MLILYFLETIKKHHCSAFYVKEINLVFKGNFAHVIVPKLESDINNNPKFTIARKH